MGSLLHVEPMCKKCGGDIILRNFYLNALLQPWEYELVVECVDCGHGDSLRLPTGMRDKEGGQDAKKTLNQ